MIERNLHEKYGKCVIENFKSVFFDYKHYVEKPLHTQNTKIFVWPCVFSTFLIDNLWMKIEYVEQMFETHKHTYLSINVQRYQNDLQLLTAMNPNLQTVPPIHDLRFVIYSCKTTWKKKNTKHIIFL